MSQVSPLHAKITHAFSKQGLGTTIANFNPRKSQLAMAEAIGECITNLSQVVIEAPTGTGKTFAYLVPALLAKRKTIISTGSKNLQDQLFKRDLPTIVKALNFTGTTALLKGRSNYLCLERLDMLLARGVEDEHFETFKQIRKWNVTTQSGDFAECVNVPEDNPLFAQLTSTTENCLGKDCPKYQDCYFLKARQKAMEADVVVINHHLFFADMAVKEGGFGEVIPSAEVIVFDEAHQIPDIASQYFGESLSSRQIFEFCTDLSIVYRVELKDLKQLDEVANNLRQVVQDFRLALGLGRMKGNWREKALEEAVVQWWEILNDKLAFAQEVIASHKLRSKNLVNLYDRLVNFRNFLNQFQQTEITGFCYWFETFERNFSLNITPLSIAQRMHKQINKPETSWIFTSATLNVISSSKQQGNGFEYFCGRMGLRDAQCLKLSSPFDYPSQALLCVPRHLPLHNSNQTLEQLGKMLLPIIKANQGRCFMLCTSYAMMNGLGEYFRANSELNVLIQGECTKNELLRKFTTQAHSVLVATSSFWEGIDVQGKALSLVIIDKLPFTAPDEPLMQARLEDCHLQKRNPFNSIQIPEAVIALKQGVGRLIRDEQDRGVIIICDSRLVMKNYGEIFLKSLPPAKRTRNLQNVLEFLAFEA